MQKNFRLAVASVLSLFLVGFLTPAAQASPSAPQAPTTNCKPDWVHTFALTGQPVTGWNIRVTGTDLQQLVNDQTGLAFATIEDSDGTENVTWRWDDRRGSLNQTVTVNGPHARIIISITNSRNTYTGCTGVYDWNHPA